jgi:hypothetical protein
LSNVELAVYGDLGALASILLIQARPVFSDLLNGRAELRVTVPAAVGALGFLVMYLAGGALAAYLGDALLAEATKPAQAIVYGIGWQSTIGGFLQST